MKMSSTSEDSGPEDRNPPKKEKKRGKPSEVAAEKSKDEPASKRKKETKGAKQESEDDWENGKIPLGSKKFISVSEFRGKKLVDIREWYGDDDNLKPGKKGISLSKEQFEKLIASAAKVMKKMEEDD